MSLLDGIEPLDPPAGDTPPAGTPPVTPPTGDGTPPPVNNDWFYDADIKGTGDKPEWLKDKYKTAADQAKAYLEIEKRLGAFKGAPDAYDLTVPDMPDITFSKDDTMINDFLESAKKNGVSQEYVTELLQTYAKAMTIGLPNPETEMKSLGANAKQDLQILNQWANSVFTPEEMRVFYNMTPTAEAVRIFDKMRQLMTAANVAPPKANSSPRETEAQVLALVNDPRYDKDEAFRMDVRKRLSMAKGVK
jgi:hypothetical protein